MSLPDAAGKDASVCPSETSRPDQRFPRSWRLTARRQFLAVYEKGRRVYSPSLAIFAVPNRIGHCRVGFTVTRKVGGAVARNRVKRVLRDIVRRNRSRLDHSLDLVVNTKPSTLTTPTAELENQFRRCIANLSRSSSR
ncbi:MAG: ribonuclease P protein component [bacterium]|nr:ribonuclease P protein component [bacterium]